MLLIKHIKGREGAADYMNKKKYGLLVGVMGVIIILLVVVLFVLIKQKSNDSDINKKIAESVVPDDLVGEWMLGDNVEYLTIYPDGTVYRYKKSNDISEGAKDKSGRCWNDKRLSTDIYKNFRFKGIGR